MRTCQYIFSGCDERMASSVQLVASRALDTVVEHKPFLGLKLPSSSSSSSAHWPSVRLKKKLHSNLRAASVVPYKVAEAVKKKNHLDQILHFYRKPFLSESAVAELLKQGQEKVSPCIYSIETEQCFNVALSSDITKEKLEVLTWLLRETFEPDLLQNQSILEKQPSSAGFSCHFLEVGPRLSFTTAWSANAVSICKACGLDEVTRIERSRRYMLLVKDDNPSLDSCQLDIFAALVHDRMTECVYPSKLTSFETNVAPETVFQVPVMEKGQEALEAINQQMGLAFDAFDLKYYTYLFRNDIKRNPTNVELFDIAQSNSEHSRHWFFKGELSIDGENVPKCLMDLVKDTLRANPSNSVIGFSDNSSAIRGFKAKFLRPQIPGSPSPLETCSRDMDILFTAETHNFPCAVAPFPGAETGAGGRIRDTHATGIGSLVVASTAGYCVGNLQLDGGFAPWEDSSFVYPANLASPLQILIDASDGASDYGNKFGEPLIQGFTRTFGMKLPNGERREWLKPIMFSAGIGQIDHQHVRKGEPESSMLVVKVGGPAYRIGMGGGAASSMVSGQNDAQLDFNAVQRGDAEMAQKLYRVIRACVEMGENNPIVSIHDQGAGGNCNVVKEIIYPEGAEIDIRSIVVGDNTLSVLEIWGAEYQEQDALLIKPEHENLLRAICARERVSMAVIGSISGSGKIVLVDSLAVAEAAAKGLPPPSPAVDLDLEKVLGDMPRKRFEFVREPPPREPLDLAAGVTVMDALKRVLHLPSVCSKRFLTTKVDRCVTGLVAQQQTVGPLQLTLSNVAVIAQTYNGITGGACAIGEQPIKGLLDPKAMARLAVGEALTNLVWAKITALEDVKASGNWMYAAKLDGEGASMYDAAVALRDAMIDLKIAIDGGKDSLSMAAQAGGELVKAPGDLVISAYASCPDITKTVTPDLKLGDKGVILFIDLANGKRRLGASAFAQVFDQIGDVCPDLDDVSYLGRVFKAVQGLVDKRSISSGHDISDGGIIVALLEMAFAGNYGLNVSLQTSGKIKPVGAALFETLFAEELGLLLEIDEDKQNETIAELAAAGVSSVVIGHVTTSPTINIAVDGRECLSASTAELRDIWEETSFMLERLQRLDSCVEAEQLGLKSRRVPSWKLSFTPTKTPEKFIACRTKPKVAIIREEGSNGDREMSAMVYSAGFEAWDVSMSDLLTQKISLKDFRGIVFVGGFSYADVLDSGKGWAATIRFNDALLRQFEEFYQRPDTFSLGVCNGCQLMALLGWIPGVEAHRLQTGNADSAQPRFIHNKSGRFECRFSSVTIKDSPAIMFQGMSGTTTGIWVAHGEGRALFPDQTILDKVTKSNLAPLRYCDDSGEVTETYPFNPNGSPLGIAALCSPDGRHLAMMPHPERCFHMWQYPWYPKDWENLDPAGPSPWMRMFQNARDWCERQDG